MSLQTAKQQGFTIVELLIVIVVIGILAAISIVSYNGIQQRARNASAESTASTLRTKAEAWYGIVGTYPTASDVSGGLVNASVPEAALGADLTGDVATSAGDAVAATVSASAPVLFQECQDSGNGNAVTGTRVHYLVEGSTDTVTTILLDGAATDCGAVTAA